MSQYTKSTNFATKDNLTPVDPIKIVRGTEIDTEYNNIATAIATKTDNASAAITGGTINATTIGATTASTGAFSTLSATGAITSTLATGTAPLVIASTTKVANLNVDSLDGADWASPAALGSTTPAAVSATTLTTSSTVTFNGGTANGLAYLNGSKVVTSGSALTFDGTNFANTGNITAGTTGSGANLVAYASTYNTNGMVRLFGTDGNNKVELGAASATTAFLTTRAGVSMIFGANDTEQMRLTSTGLGIGTSSPNAKLNVVKSADNSRIAIGDNVATGTYSTLLMYGGLGKYNFQLGVQNNVNNAFEITPSTAVNGTTFSTPAFVLDSSGNVGIGTSSPAYKLDVQTANS